MSDLLAGIEIGRTFARIEAQLLALEISGAAAAQIESLRADVAALQSRVFVAEETVADAVEEVHEEIADANGDGESGDEGGDVANVEVNVEQIVEAVDDALEAVNDAVEDAGEAVESTVKTALEESPADDTTPERNHILDRPLFGNRG
jgi:hypothetical protein